MENWTNYHHLFYFKTIAEEGGVSAAAKKLRLGQPTLSAQLRQFEDSLGLLLFERQGKRLKLTEQGKQVLYYAKEIFNLGAEMRSSCLSLKSSKIQTIHIASLDSIPKNFVLNLCNFALKQKNVRLSVSEGDAEGLIEKLLLHRLDLFITNFIPKNIDNGSIDYKRIYSRPVKLYAAPTFKKSRSGFPKSLIDKPFVVPTFTSKIRHDLNHWLTVNNISVKIVAETQDIALTKLMGVNGLGIFPATQESVIGLVKRGELIEIGELEGVKEDVFICRSTKKNEDPIVERIFDTFKIS